MASPGAKKLTDPRELRAIAHPLRNRLLTELFGRQAATVTELAKAVGEPVNKVSFHLRLLAKYGFIEEAPEFARDGRDRWWRLAYADGFDWDELAVTHPAVLRTQANEGLERSLQAIRHFYTSANEELPKWDETWFSHDWYLHLKPNEIAEFNREYLDLCFRWRDQVNEKVVAGDSEGRESFAIFIYGFPLQQSREAGAR
jgi:hypothetical protein